MSLFEAGMLICFGASWPFAVIKTYKTKNVKGHSKAFLFLLLSGYIFGILHKIFFNLDLVIIFYLINTSFVLTELFLYYRYKDK
ncbi:MAG: hypothetical protein A2287_07990 [Candidatus Melainabacteria bacterium RIFOXYA12_FULL_32_12]|nr:MAG: hypothetical protein A2255_08910 [Candidatus Melainabacteria bacterium RIFOXYA2_FULL_32_9]OGI25927.1 MAG: hypothetical protein A2287_07990 [Candidatus Melainabacteria bacterium RIFOXYA12_FULL_32_12]